MQGKTKDVPFILQFLNINIKKIKRKFWEIASIFKILSIKF